MNTTPNTELDALNIMLETIGASPVTALDLDNIENLDLIVARDTLDIVTQELQMEEWHFNTEQNYPFTPECDGTIKAPSNIVRIQPDQKHLDVVIRGSKLYNKTDHTYQFDTPFTATVTLSLPFEQTPLPARNYITIRAARKLANNSVGDSQLEAWTAQDEKRARAAFVASDNRQANLSLGWKYKLDPVTGNDFR